MYYFLIFHCNNGDTNVPQCYVTRKLPVLFIILIAHARRLYQSGDQYTLVFKGKIRKVLSGVHCVFLGLFILRGFYISAFFFKTKNSAGVILYKCEKMFFCPEYTKSHIQIFQTRYGISFLNSCR